MERTGLRLDELQAAVDHCMRAHPPSGLELTLHPDASAMADLWARMLLERKVEVPAADIPAKVMTAFERWRVSADPADLAFVATAAA